MKINNGFNILPWYDSLEKQNCKKWYAYGQAWPLLCPQGLILPFQFISDTAITISSNIYAISVETGQAIDLGVKPTVTEISRADITYYIVKLVSTSIVNLPIGRYNLRMNTSEGFLYSEEIVVINNANECIKVEYWNEDTLKFTSGEINFTDDFHFIFYINSTIGKPEYEFEEELTKRLGYKFIESQTSNKVYKFSFVAPEYICDAMRLIRMCDYIKLTTKFDSYNALSFAYEPKWQEQGDLAAVDVEFDTDCIIQKLESFNRRAKESFYNALLADIDEPVLFSTDTVAQYYTEYTASGAISGKLIRQLTAISEDELVSSLSSIVLPVDNQSDNSQVAKKAFLSDIVNKLIPKVNLSDYLLKSVWDKVWEIRTDSTGQEYIFGKLPVVTQYGITMYVGDGGDIDLPSLYAGLPIDNTTIYWENGVLKAVGSSGGGGVADSVAWGNVTGKPSWITDAKPTYAYYEITGTPDLTKYALQTDIPSLSGYATESWVIGKGYALDADLDALTTIVGDKADRTELAKYIPISGYTEVSGEKNFTGGLKVNGSPIYYDATNKYWKLEGDLLVTGGVTMYANEGTYTPSTIMDALLYDDTTLGINSEGKLYVKGGTGGGLDITELQNYLTQNSYLNVTEGDGRYLKLSGGTISGQLTVDGYYFKAKEISGIALELSNAQPYIDFHFNNDTGDFTTRLIEDIKGQLTIIGRLVVSNGLDVHNTLRVYDTTIAKWHKVLHEGNYSSYALPLSGGTLTGALNLPIDTYNYIGSSIALCVQSDTPNALRLYTPSGRPALAFFNDDGWKGTLGVNENSDLLWSANKVWHAGNFTPSNYLPLSGGTMTGNILLGGTTTNKIGTNIVDTTGGFQEFTHQNSYGYITLGPLNTSVAHIYTDRPSFYFNKELLVNNNKVWHAGNDGSGSGLNADTLDGKHLSDILASNVASATKLQTARTIWGQSFDGTGNITGQLNITTVNNVALTNGTGSLTIGPMSNVHIAIDNNDIQAKADGTTASILYLNDYGGSVSMCRGGGKVGIGTSTPSQQLHLTAGMYIADYIHFGAATMGGIRYIARTGGWAPAYINHLNAANNLTLAAFGIYGGGDSVYNFWWGLGYTNTWMTLDTSGNLLVKGGMTMYSQKSLKNIQDERGLSLEEMSIIKPTRYTWKDGRDNRIHFGGIADDIQQVLPEVVYKTNEGILTMDYGNAAFAVASSLIKPVISHEAKITMLQQRIEELEEEVERLKAS